MTRSRFAGGDQGYLRDEQYADASNLSARATLHQRYGTATTPWFDWVRARIDLRVGDRVVDVGCGPGWLWQPGAVPVPAGVELTVCDLSPGMVGEAVARATAGGPFESVEGHVVDAQSLPFEPASFDRVVANHMLYHLPDPRLGVAELARVVRRGGHVLVATNGSGHLHELHEVQADVLDVPYEDATLAVFGTEVAFGLLREHFAEVRWEAYPDTLRCTDVDDVLAYVCSSPPGEDATPDQRIALRDALVARMVDGVLTITKDVGAFRCVVERASPLATGAR